MLDVVWSNLENLIEDRPCNGSEAVARHHILFDPHCSHGGRMALSLIGCVSLQGLERRIVRGLWGMELPQDSKCLRGGGTMCGVTWMSLEWKVVGEAGIEPTTPGLEGRCSIQLSYSPVYISF